jgi:hypothetical protein
VLNYNIETTSKTAENNDNIVHASSHNDAYIHIQILIDIDIDVCIYRYIFISISIYTENRANKKWK